MDRRMFVKSLGLYSTQIAISSSLLPACKIRKMNSIQYVKDDFCTFEELRRGVGYFVGKGGTIGWSVSKNEVSIVDTQFPEQITRLLSELDKYNADGKIDLLI